VTSSWFLFFSFLLYFDIEPGHRPSEAETCNLMLKDCSYVTNICAWR